MKHLGDITAIDWSKVEPVDVVTGGSPCQDLSVAGKRAGLAGERSGLYMEQIRCVKELRAADVLRGRTGEFIRPRYMVWENVPGAFSSGKPKGADFAAVIEEIIKVAEPDAYVCVMPPDSGWSKSGCYYDRDGRWSIAWRVHDAQFWGVPQRRKRISLIADFGGLSAPEILFERKGLSGHFEQSRAQRENTSPNAEGSLGADDSEGESAGGAGRGLDAVGFLRQLSGVEAQTEVAPTLMAAAGMSGNNKPSVAYTLKAPTAGGGAVGAISFQERAGCPGGGKGILIQPERTGALSTLNNQSICYGVDLYNQTTTGDVSKTLNSVRSDADHTPCVIHEPLCIEMTSTKNTVVEDGISPTLTARMGTGALIQTDKAATLSATQDQYLFQPTYCIEGNGQRESHRGDGYIESETMYTLNTAERHAVAYSRQRSDELIENDVASTQSARQYKDATDLVVQPIVPASFYPQMKAESQCFRQDNKAIPQAGDPCHTLGTDSRNWLVEPILIESNQNHATIQTDGVCTALPAAMGMGGGYVPMVAGFSAVAKGPGAVSIYQNVTGPLMANSHPGSYCGQDAYQDMLVAGLDCRNGRENGDLCGTLQSKPNGGFSYNCIRPVRCNNIVRRLTPLECERLQGYPDGWTDIGEWVDSKGKRHKEADSPRYKALGNSIALPFWKWMLKRISAQYERDATLGSLFDGIGGFPLCWEQINGKGTARWASEIEEFPIAVTKIRFPEE